MSDNIDPRLSDQDLLDELEQLMLEEAEGGAADAVRMVELRDALGLPQ